MGDDERTRKRGSIKGDMMSMRGGAVRGARRVRTMKSAMTETMRTMRGAVKGSTRDAMRDKESTLSNMRLEGKGGRGR